MKVGSIENSNSMPPLPNGNFIVNDLPSSPGDIINLEILDNFDGVQNEG